MQTTEAYTDRNETIKIIRANLKARSGRGWSVKGGRGTAWGWIEVDTTPAREAAGHGDADRKELARLMGLDTVHQNLSIAASQAHYREHIERSEGKVPTKIAQAYWD